MSHVLMWRAADAGGAVSPHRIVKYGDADGKVVQSAAAADAHVGVSGRASAASGEMPRIRRRASSTSLPASCCCRLSVFVAIITVRPSLSAQRAAGTR